MSTATEQASTPSSEATASEQSSSPIPGTEATPTDTPPKPTDDKIKQTTTASNDLFRFQGIGVSFKAKIIGVTGVDKPRGDDMCQLAITHQKGVVKAKGEHKQRITINISLDGIKILDEKTGSILHHHAVNRISFISRDATDPRTFGYIFGPGDGTHKFFGIKTAQAAEAVTFSLRDLFQVVYEMKKNANAKNTEMEATPSSQATTEGQTEKPEQPPIEGQQEQQPTTQEPHYQVPRRIEQQPDAIYAVVDKTRRSSNLLDMEKEVGGIHNVENTDKDGNSFDPLETGESLPAPITQQAPPAQSAWPGQQQLQGPWGQQTAAMPQGQPAWNQQQTGPWGQNQGVAPGWGPNQQMPQQQPAGWGQQVPGGQPNMWGQTQGTQASANENLFSDSFAAVVTPGVTSPPGGAMASQFGAAATPFAAQGQSFNMGVPSQPFGATSTPVNPANSDPFNTTGLFDASSVSMGSTQGTLNTAAMESAFLQPTQLNPPIIEEEEPAPLAATFNELDILGGRRKSNIASAKDLFAEKDKKPKVTLNQLKGDDAIVPANPLSDPFSVPPTSPNAAPSFPQSAEPPKPTVAVDPAFDVSVFDSGNNPFGSSTTAPPSEVTATGNSTSDPFSLSSNTNATSSKAVANGTVMNGFNDAFGMPSSAPPPLPQDGNSGFLDNAPSLPPRPSGAPIAIPGPPKPIRSSIQASQPDPFAAFQ